LYGWPIRSGTGSEDRGQRTEDRGQRTEASKPAKIGRWPLRLRPAVYGPPSTARRLRPAVYGPPSTVFGLPLNRVPDGYVKDGALDRATGHGAAVLRRSRAVSGLDDAAGDAAPGVAAGLRREVVLPGVDDDGPPDDR